MLSNLGQRFAGRSVLYEKETTGTTSGGAGVPTSSSDPVVSEPAVYSQVADQDRFLLGGGTRVDDGSFLMRPARGYTIKGARLTRVNLWLHNCLTLRLG